MPTRSDGIAALEGAEAGVRVNMVNADAVFGTPENPSGLWQEVGPARAEARGLDPEDLPEYYRSRNLLKLRVTADHVGNAVVFFAVKRRPPPEPRCRSTAGYRTPPRDSPEGRVRTC